MKKNKTIHLITKICLLFILLSMLSGCVSNIQVIRSRENFQIVSSAQMIRSRENYQINGRGKTIAKKPLTEVIIENYKDGTTRIFLTSPIIKSAALIGDMSKDESGDYHLYIDRIDFLDNWPNGWTSGSSEASGEILFDTSGDYLTAHIVESFQLWEQTKGEIRYFDDYYRGDKGFEKVKNRMNRIHHIVTYLKEQQLPDYFGHKWRKTAYGAPFTKSVKSILFKNDNLPEHLQPLLKSGTLMRDFEEAAGLIIMEYNMEYYFSTILEGAQFIEFK